MLTPPGWGALLYKRSTYFISLLLFAVGTILSATSVGALIALLGHLLLSVLPFVRPILWYLIALAALAYSVAELQGARWPVPEAHWQVPRQWDRWGKLAYATMFGLILGAGFFTYIRFIGYHLVLASCLLVADPVYGGIVMACFGAVRAAPVVLAPLVSSFQGRPYTFQVAANLNDWFLRFIPRTWWLRAVTLLTFAGLALAQG